MLVSLTLVNIQRKEKCVQNVTSLFIGLLIIKKMILLKLSNMNLLRSCRGQAGASKNGIEEKLLHLPLILGLLQFYRLNLLPRTVALYGLKPNFSDKINPYGLWRNSFNISSIIQ
jgi:hypothetical protein